MRWPRRKQPDSADDAEKALYVHLANDGPMFVVWGGTGEQAWIDETELHDELDKLKAAGGRLMYSRDSGDRDPPPHVLGRFRRTVDHEVPIHLMETPHPQALVPPEARRTLRRH